jgi:hypothetical protein
MDPNSIENLRLKLQRRVGRLKPQLEDEFHFQLCQLWDFVAKQPILFSSLEELAMRHPEVETHVNKMFDGSVYTYHQTFESRQTAFSYFLIKRCVEKGSTHCEHNIGQKYGRSSITSLETFKSLFIIPLYEYLDECLDDVHLITAILVRYKQKCEWFQRKYLFDKQDIDTSKAEENLKFHLFDYLHDQGVNLTIEPYSVKGRIDLIYDQKGEDRVFAEVKVLRSRNDKGNIVEGFSQLIRYLDNFNATVGYLVVYKACEEELSFSLSHQFQSLPYEIYGSKTVIVIPVDLFVYDTCISERRKIKPIRITSEDLFSEIN